MRVYIYGAGVWCRALLASNLLSNYELYGIIDRDQKKQGSQINGHDIFSPEILNTVSFDEVIIAVQPYREVIKSLINWGIPYKKISYYDRWKQMIIRVEDSFDRIQSELFYLSDVREFVKKGMIYDAFKSGELNGFDRLIVIGTDDDLRLFKGLPIDADIINDKQADLIGNTDKLIFTDRDYREKIDFYMGKGIRNNQWVIIPVFTADSYL